MPRSFPVKWIECPPRFIVAGDCIYTRALTQILSAATLVTNEMLRVGFSPPPLPNLPLQQALEAVIVILADAESESSLLWRHRQIWMLPGRPTPLPGWRLDNVRWIFLAADNRQAEWFSNRDVLGREPAKHTFRTWKPESYKFLSREAGLVGTLEGIAQLRPAKLTSWIGELTGDTAISAIRAFRHLLEQTNDPTQIGEALRILEQSVPELHWEHYFRHFPPPQHHVLGNQMRSWLAVTKLDTLWLEVGRILFSKLQT